MKKKIFLALMLAAIIACLFAITISAAEPSSSDAYGEITLITDNEAINAKTHFN